MPLHWMHETLLPSAPTITLHSPPLPPPLHPLSLLFLSLQEEEAAEAREEAREAVKRLGEASEAMKREERERERAALQAEQQVPSLRHCVCDAVCAGVGAADAVCGWSRRCNLRLCVADLDCLGGGVGVGGDRGLPCGWFDLTPRPSRLSLPPRFLLLPPSLLPPFRLLPPPS